MTATPAISPRTPQGPPMLTPNRRQARRDRAYERYGRDPRPHDERDDDLHRTDRSDIHPGRTAARLSPSAGRHSAIRPHTAIRIATRASDASRTAVRSSTFPGLDRTADTTGRHAPPRRTRCEGRDGAAGAQQATTAIEGPAWAAGTQPGSFPQPRKDRTHVHDANRPSNRRGTRQGLHRRQDHPRVGQNDGTSYGVVHRRLDRAGVQFRRRAATCERALGTVLDAVNAVDAVSIASRPRRFLFHRGCWSRDDSMGTSHPNESPDVRNRRISTRVAVRRLNCSEGWCTAAWTLQESRGGAARNDGVCPPRTPNGCTTTHVREGDRRQGGMQHQRRP